MENKKILLCLEHMSGREMDFIKDAFATNWIGALGPNVSGFEQDLEQFITRKYPNPSGIGVKGVQSPENKRVVALCNGTSAVHLSLIACGVEPGDEVMTQTFTFCASANPIKYVGAMPVFVDSEPDSWNMDPQLLDEAISDRIRLTGSKPKAIMVVHLYGMPARMKDIISVGIKYDIPVIEDAAEGLGSNYCGRACGTFGRFGILSFNGNKMITASGGGALICPDDRARDEVMFYATQARESYPYYQHEKLGYNYRMSNICAGVGRGQMTIIDEHLAHHRHVQNLYKEYFKDIEGIRLHDNPGPEYDSNFWLCAITIDNSIKVRNEDDAYVRSVKGSIGGVGAVTHGGENPHTESEPNRNVEAMRLALGAGNIESRPLWKPMHLQPLYKDCAKYVNGVSEGLFKTGLCLPAGPWVTDADVALICDTIKNNIIY